MTIFNKLLLGLLVLLYLGGIVLAILSKLQKGPFAVPKLVNTHLLVSNVTTFDLNPTCKKIAYILVKVAPSGHGGVDQTYLTGPSYHPRLCVTVIDFINRKSESSRNTLIWKFSKHNFSMKTSGRCSVTVEVETYAAPLLIEVYGF